MATVFPRFFWQPVFCFGQKRAHFRRAKIGQPKKAAGQIAGFDALVWFLVVLSAFLLVLQWSGFWVQETKNDFESMELQRNGIMLMDSLVKNRDAEKPQYGSAVFNAEKRRVQSNELDMELLQAIPAAQSDENAIVFFQAIELRFAGGTRETVFETGKKGNCLATERFVLVEKKKAVVRGVVCRE